MKLTFIHKLIVLFLGTFLFYVLFWNEFIGLNIIIFHAFVLITSFFGNINKPSKLGMLFAGLSTVLVFIVVYHNSVMSFFTYLISIVAFIGFIHQYSLKTIPFALLESLSNYFIWPKEVLENFRNNKKIGFNSNTISKYSRLFRLTLLPILITFIFAVIFYNANVIFSEFVDRTCQNLLDFFSNFMIDVSPIKLIFILWGFSIVGWILFKRKLSNQVKKEELLSDQIIRTKVPLQNKTKVFLDLNIYRLVNENNTGTILLVMVNLLLIIINFIDIRWVWFDFDTSALEPMWEAVHEGTYLLILSILLSMLILIYLFRKNQNFYPRSNKLKNLSFIWIIQNIILLISVALRNYHYIEIHGLAYRRIGVYFFLIATVGGLITMYIKIKDKKSSYYLIRLNSWIVYSCFFIMSLINWDSVILKHNLNHSNPNNMDVEFISYLSSKTLPTLYKNKNKLDIMGWEKSLHRRGRYNESIKYRVAKFKNSWESHGWLSWNYLDYKAYQYFEELKWEIEDK